MAFDPNEPMKDRITDIGPPHYEQFFPPVIKDNYGKWKYHEILEPGVLVHVSETGAEVYTVRVGGIRLMSVEVYTVRVGGIRLMSVDLIRETCEIADKHCDGYLRFTTRNNIEFMVDDKAKLQPLMDDLKSRKFEAGSNKFPIGGHHQHRPHPGLDPLSHPGHRRLRYRQGCHG